MSGTNGDGAPKRRVPAEELTVGAWLVYARRQVVAIQRGKDDGVTVEAVGRAGAHFTHRWKRTTPVVVGPPEQRRPADRYNRSP